MDGYSVKNQVRRQPLTRKAVKPVASKRCRREQRESLRMRGSRRCCAAIPEGVLAPALLLTATRVELRGDDQQDPCVDRHRHRCAGHADQHSGHRVGDVQLLIRRTSRRVVGDTDNISLCALNCRHKKSRIAAAFFLAHIESRFPRSGGPDGSISCPRCR